MDIQTFQTATQHMSPRDKRAIMPIVIILLREFSIASVNLELALTADSAEEAMEYLTASQTASFIVDEQLSRLTTYPQLNKVVRELRSLKSFILEDQVEQLKAIEAFLCKSELPVIH